MRRHSWSKLKYIFVNRVEPVTVWIFTICTFFSQLLNLFERTETGWKWTGEWWNVLIAVIWALAAIVVISFQLIFYIKQKRFTVTNLQNKLYAAAMRAQEKSNEAKIKSILQITYGNVPEWNPRNYENNVLLYDGHEHIRRILMDMRDALRDILSTEDKQVAADAVSVDLVYCYPSKECDGLLPAYSTGTGNNNTADWRVITSSTSSIMGLRGTEKKDIHKFLEDPNSFYCSLAQKGYVFRNSKTISKEKRNDESGGFIVSLKDVEYGSIGSIAGQMLAIRNDQPTVVLLNAILTITTYGVELCADDSGVKEEEYKEIFRSSFINPYKFLLESELAQLYIRHKIREQEMCMKTGFANISDTANPKKRKCMLQDHCDYQKADNCPKQKKTKNN